MLQTRLEAELPFIRRLQSGDAEAFTALVNELHGRLLRLARSFTRSPALAEDIVQETWLGVIRGLREFEGRSSLRTWIYSILANRARTMAAREAKRAASPFAPSEPGARSVEWEPGRGRIGLWEEAPVPWNLEDPAAVLQTQEALEVVGLALQAMPARQRQVLILRDVENLPASEVCNILALSETNLRVLLHRARARVRRDLDRYVRSGAVSRGKRPIGALAAPSDGVRP